MYMAKSRSHQTDQFSLKKILRQIKFCRSFFRAHTHAHETHSSKPLIPAASAHRNCTFPCKLRRVSFQQSTSIHLCLNTVERYTTPTILPEGGNFTREPSERLHKRTEMERLHPPSLKLWRDKQARLFWGLVKM